VTDASESLPTDLATAHVMILAERTGRLEAEAKLANARAEAALIAYYKLEIDGRVMYEIDMVAGIQVVDGKDQLADIRTALGL